MGFTVKQAEEYDQAGLDHAYDARGSVADFDAAIQPYSDDSAKAREQLDCQLDVAYGPGRDEVLDIFPPRAAGAPIQFFVHGGYWRALTKDESSFPAAAFVPAGASYVCNSYSLAPNVALDEIVRQNRAALAWVYENADQFGGDRNRIHVAGHSAGGHLVAMLLTTDWENDYGLPADVIKSAATISGLFDLRPIRHCFVNEWLGLDDAAAERNSPILHLGNTGCPLVMTYGDQDPDGFKEQSDVFLAAWRASGHAGIDIPMPGHTHFSVVLELAKPASPLLQAIFEQMSL